MAIFKKHPKTSSPTRRYADYPLFADDANRFLMPDGGVRWLSVGASPMSGHCWMAGHKARFCLYYGVDEEYRLSLLKHCVYPFLTAGGYSTDFDYMPSLEASGAPLVERVSFIETRGCLRIVSQSDGFAVSRTFYPAVQSMGLVERVEVTNLAPTPRTVRILMPTAPTTHIKGGSVPISSGVTLADDRGRMLTDLTEQDERHIPPEEEGVFYLVYWSKPREEDLMVDCRLEWKKRQEQIADAFADTLTIATPEPLFDRAFAHALLFATEHLSDTPTGVLPFADGLRVGDMLDVLPMLPLSGVHRADVGAKALLSLLSTEDIPALFDANMHPSGAYSPVTYALALARYALAVGVPMAGTLFAAVETLVERVTRSLRDGLYTPKRRADCATQCAVYALLRAASRLALALDMSIRATGWEGQAAQLRRRIDAEYLAPFVASPRSRPADRASFLWALYYGVDDRADALGRALIVDWIAHLEGTPALREDLVEPLSEVYALARSGFADAACEMARRYTVELMLGAHAPYPVDAHPPYGDQSPYVAWRYCHTLLMGWLGLEVLSFERLALNLHLPKGWRHLAVRGIHLGNLVLNVVWREEHLLIQDIFGQIYYDGSAVCGQHIEVALSH